MDEIMDSYSIIFFSPLMDAKWNVIILQWYVYILTFDIALMKSTESHEPQQDASELVYSPNIIGFALKWTGN